MQPFRRFTAPFGCYSLDERPSPSALNGVPAWEPHRVVTFTRLLGEQCSGAVTTPSLLQQGELANNHAVTLLNSTCFPTWRSPSLKFVHLNAVGHLWPTEVGFGSPRWLYRAEHLGHTQSVGVFVPVAIGNSFLSDDSKPSILPSNCQSWKARCMP